MITPRHNLFPALILSLAACSTQDLDGDAFLRQPQFGDTLLSVVGSITAPGGTLRIKANGRYLVSDVAGEVAGGTWVFWELQGGVHSGSGIPAGEPIDLVDEAGQTVLHIDPVHLSTTTSTPILIWVHDLPDGPVVEFPDLFPDNDETTVEVHAVNVSVTERAILSRCVGKVWCATCTTTPVSPVFNGDFPLSDCEALATIGPGEQWTWTAEPTNVTDGSGAACLAIHDEGSPLGPMCAVELNRPSVLFQERTDIFIDGMPTVYSPSPDGGLIPFPGYFMAGNRRAL